MQTNSNAYTKFSMLMLFLKGSKRFFIVSILSSAAVAGLDMLVPQIVRIVVDGCLSSSSEALPAVVRRFLEREGGREYIIGHLYLVALAVAAAAVLTAVFQYFTDYLNARGTELMMKRARDILFAHIEKLPFSWHMRNETGDIIQRCTSDVTMVRNFISEQLVQVVRIVVLILFSVIVMVSMSVKLSIVVLFSVPIIILYSYFFFQRSSHLFLKCDENEGVLSTIAQENLTGVRVVRAFGRENYERERFLKQNHVYTDAWMDLCKLLSGFWAAGDLVMSLQLMLLVILGTVFCVKGQLTAGMLIAFISYNRRLTWPVRRLGRMISEMSKAGVSMDRLLYILNSPPEELDKEGPEPELTGDVVFEHVSFSYSEGEKVLKDVSFNVPGGTTLGILGGTGSGKSTLMHLLNRLYPLTEGRITIGGVPVEEMPLSWLRSHVGMVLQEPYLFSRTIRENISIARESTMEEIRHAAQVACIDESICRFARGYDTMVGERGVTLSGGQKQRTAIARMLVQDTPIMIFDDSLSAVDAETDEKIRRALKQYMGKATVIIISHRISTLMDADQILVLENGKVLQQGTHQELMKEKGLYQEIYEIQSPDWSDEIPAGGEESGRTEAAERAEASAGREREAEEKGASAGREREPEEKKALAGQEREPEKKKAAAGKKRKPERKKAAAVREKSGEKGGKSHE